MNRSTKKKKAFTLVELVIVIAVIGILASVLIPTFADVIRSSKKSANKQQATAVRDEYIVITQDPESTIGSLIKVKDDYFIIGNNLELKEINPDDLNLDEYEEIYDITGVKIYKVKNDNVYKITFNADGGTVDTDYTTMYVKFNTAKFFKDYNLSQTCSNMPIATYNPDGYDTTFEGWKDNNQILVIDNNGNLLKNTKYINESGKYIYEGNVTLIASYTKSIITYNISYVYKDNLGNELPSESITNTNPTTYDVETSFQFKDATMNEYNFKGWYTDIDLTENITELTIGNFGDKTFYGKFEKMPKASYTVRHLKQNESLDNYVLADTDTSEEDFVGKEVTATAKTYEGFTLDTTKSIKGIVLDDGSLVINVYYNRNNYNFTYLVNTFDNNGFITDSYENYTSEDDFKTYTYGVSKTLPTLTQTGYTFKGWKVDKDSSDTLTILSQKLTTKIDGITLYSYFEANTNTAYTVNHYVQGITQSEPNYTLIETQNLTGTTGQDTNITTITLENSEYFGIPSITQQKIKADGSLVVNIYYDRKVGTVNWVNYDNSNLETQTYRYGATPSYNGTPTKNEKGYTSTFTGWTPTITIVTKDTTTYTATFNDTANTYNLTYKVNTFSSNGIIITDKYENYTSEDDFKTYTYGVSKTLPTLTQTGYTFKGWKVDNSGETLTTLSQELTTKIDGIILYSHYVANTDTAYTVNHYVQGITQSETDYTLTTQNLTGTTGQDTNITTIALENSDYFVTPSITQQKIKPDGSLVIDIYYYRKEGIVNWVNYDNSNLETQTYRYGATPSYNGTPTKNEKGYTSTFTGWTPAITIITKDTTTYTATFNDTAITYSITYNGLNQYCDFNDGENLTQYTIENTFSLYNPNKDGFTFTGWTGSNGNTPQKEVSITKGTTGNLEYTANFTKDYETSEENNELTITKYIASKTEIVIPKSIEGISVTSIGVSAFGNCTSLTDIIIPNSVTSIGNSAFSRCTNLINVTIPNSVPSINSNTFSFCTSLTSVTIPGSVTSITKSAFEGCTSLANLVVENENTIYDSRNNCNAIIETATNKLIVGCKTTIIPNSVTYIGMNAFSSCTTLTSITIPNSVAIIGWSAFEGCSGLTSITIPSSIATIGPCAFLYCTNLTNVDFEGKNHWKAAKTSINSSDLYNTSTAATLLTDTYTGSDWTKDFSSMFTFTQINNEEVSITKYIGLDTIVTIPSNMYGTYGNKITAIAGDAFHSENLTSLTIPSSITSIGRRAFDTCSKLTSVTFNDPNNWKIPDFDISINASDLSDASIAASYLTDKYKINTWTKGN